MYLVRLWYLECLMNCYSVAKSCLTFCNHIYCSMPGPSVLHSLPEFAQIHVHWVIDAIYLILCHPLLLPSVFPSIKAFSSESNLCIKGPKYWSFRFSISTANEYSRLISFRIDWFDLFTVQGILKSLFQHHSLKASILHCSAFFVIQLSHLYMIIQTKNMCVTHPVSYIFPRKNWQNWVPSSASP